MGLQFGEHTDSRHNLIGKIQPDQKGLNLPDRV